MFAARPSQPPPTLFPSQRFQPAAAIRVQPVLSPDNYMKIIPDFIREAKKSIFIEQQYIHASEVDVNDLCQAIRDAMDATKDLDVRIIVAPPFMNTVRDRQSVQKDLMSLQNDFQLQTDTNVRLLNHRYFTHLHNKLIIIDNEAVLISSQNWSTQAVTKNREAGLIIRYPELAAYYAKIFELDWSTAVRSLGRAPTPPAMLSVAPEAAAALSAATEAGAAILLSPGDYADV